MIGSVLRILLGCALAISCCSQSFAQKKLLYKLIMGGVIVLVTPSKGEADAFKKENPQAQISKVSPTTPDRPKSDKRNEPHEDEEEEDEN